MTAAPSFVDVDGHWSLQAPCRDVDTEVFFPEPGAGSRADTPKRICITCPERARCLAEYLDEPQGIYGGLSVGERTALKRNGWQLGDPLPKVKLKVKSRPVNRDPDDTSYAEPDEAWTRAAHQYATATGRTLAQVARHVGVSPMFLAKRFARHGLKELPDGRGRRIP